MLRHRRNTRYGWVANPYPTGTFTLQDAPSFAWRALTVGTPVTRRPPYRPGRALFPHPVPRLYSLSRKAFALCKYPMSLLRLRESWFQNPEAVYGPAEGVPSETFPLAAPSVQPFERTLNRPVVEAP